VHAKHALSGDGGLYAAGRWSLRGTRVVYASATMSLAALELLVRIEDSRPTPELVAVEIDIPDSVEIQRISLKRLPAGWNASPAPVFTQSLGTDWVASKRSAVLEVPSAVIPRESNYLLNPEHPRFSRIRVVSTAPFSTNGATVPPCTARRLRA
jgi:RES domain-containing protein